MRRLKFYWILTFIALPGVLFSQLINVSGDLVYTGSIAVEDDYELKTHIDVINATGQSRTVKVYRVLEDVVPLSQNKFCWGGLCYGFHDDESALSNSMAPGQSIAADELTAFTGYYYHEGNAGCSQISYCFYDTNDEEAETCFEVRFAVDAECAVGMAEMVIAPQLSMKGANPATGRFNIEYDFGRPVSKGSLVIRNLTGVIAREVPLVSRSGLILLDSEEFDPGVYMYSIMEGNQVLSTKKLVVSK